MKELDFLEAKVENYGFSFQQTRELIEIAIDLTMWDEEDITQIWDDTPNKKYQGKQLKSALLQIIKSKYNGFKNSPNNYKNFNQPRVIAAKIKIQSKEKEDLGFGMCPVASEKTRCCNLLTLDAVESCGFDCSYCSIQSFYNEGKVTFDTSLKDKLQNIEIDPDEFYHIGTGQSSDSLMWGNRFGILDELVNFARKHPNVLLEFKTKSDRISYFLEQVDLPKNLLFTWSLNPQIIIDNEEHLTASLENRLKAAKQMQDKGHLIGFHFHPMIHIENWQQEYGDVFSKMLNLFDPKKVVMLSLGTLTFIKPVIKQIRARDFKTKILQLPMVEASGKLSYPIKTKIEMFKFAYDSLAAWKKEVYFYLCMEDHSLWEPIFGFDYPTNDSFEMAMKDHYRLKVDEINLHR